MNHPERKIIRLRNYDYSLNGAYFITICSYNKTPILSNISGGNIQLSSIGGEVENSIKYIGEIRKNLFVDKYIIMPNHVHFILVNQSNCDEKESITKTIGMLKSYTDYKYKKMINDNDINLWQRSYYEHVIRNELDYLEIWNYIDQNPLKWDEDKYYL